MLRALTLQKRPHCKLMLLAWKRDPGEPNGSCLIGSAFPTLSAMDWGAALTGQAIILGISLVLGAMRKKCGN